MSTKKPASTPVPAKAPANKSTTDRISQSQNSGLIIKRDRSTAVTTFQAPPDPKTPPNPNK